MSTWPIHPLRGGVERRVDPARASTSAELAADAHASWERLREGPWKLLEQSWLKPGGECPGRRLNRLQPARARAGHPLKGHDEAAFQKGDLTVDVGDPEAP